MAKTCTSIPISFFLSRDAPAPSNSLSCSSQSFRHIPLPAKSPAPPEVPCPEITAATSLLSLADPAPRNAPESDTIVVSQETRKPRPVPIQVIPYSGPSSAPTTRPRKRRNTAGEPASRASKRPRRTRTLPSRIIEEPLTPPATPPAGPNGFPEASRPQTQALPPTSIVTKRNRVTQEFRNGVTSVQVPREQQPSAAPVQEPTEAPVVPIVADRREYPASDPSESCTIREAALAQETTSEPKTPRSPLPSPSCKSEAEQSSASVSQPQSTGHNQPAVNWDCHTHVVQDQKIYTTYEKPSRVVVQSNASTGGSPAPKQVYNKMTTKTVTITITTTIATTEILRPGEVGYEDALERHRAQSRLSEEEKERLRREYEGSKVWASPEGARRLNGERHWACHRGVLDNGRLGNPNASGSNSSERATCGGGGGGGGRSEGMEMEMEMEMGIQQEQERVVKREMEEEREVQVKVEVPEDATMEEVSEAVRVKVEEMEENE